MNFLCALGVASVMIYTLWIFYLASMALIRAKTAGTISKLALFLGWPIAIAGLTIDFLVNMTVVSILLLELPRELLVTRRLHRHLTDGSGWRLYVAHFICTNLLDTFDPTGAHCT